MFLWLMNGQTYGYATGQTHWYATTCFMLPAYAHGDNYALEPNFKKVTSEESAIKTLGIKTQKVIEENIDEIIKTTGQIEAIPNNQFDITSSVEGKVKTIFVNLGDEVKPGQPLAEIQSATIAKLASDVNQFKAEVEQAKNTFEREKLLFEQGVSAKKEFDAAKAMYAGVEAKLNAAQNSLRILAGNMELSSDGTFNLRTQKRGTIFERNITVGQVINVNQLLFRGVDISSVWASADIYEKDTGKVEKELKAIVFLDTYPDKFFEGKLTYVGAVINKDTRTLPVKATLKNSPNGLILRPGAFVQMIIHTGQKKKSIVIPRTALLEIDKEGTDGKHMHRVYLKKGKSFIPRKVEVESHDSSTVEVLSGLMSGEDIVVQGAYQLQFGESKENEHNHDKPLFNITYIISILLIVIALIFGLYLGKKIAKN